MAEAAKYYYGTSEKLHVITETRLVNEGKPISLCYKTSTSSSLSAPFSMTSDATPSRCVR